MTSNDDRVEILQAGMDFIPLEMDSHSPKVVKNLQNSYSF